MNTNIIMVHDIKILQRLHLMNLKLILNLMLPLFSFLCVLKSPIEGARQSSGIYSFGRMDGKVPIYCYLLWIPNVFVRWTIIYWKLFWIWLWQRAELTAEDPISWLSGQAEICCLLHFFLGTKFHSKRARKS